MKNSDKNVAEVTDLYFYNDNALIIYKVRDTPLQLNVDYSFTTQAVSKPKQSPGLRYHSDRGV